MLILILIDVQYLQKLVFSFEKGSNVQNHSVSDSHHSIKKFPPAKFPIPLLRGFYCLLLNFIWKTLIMGDIHLSPKLKNFMLIIILSSNKKILNFQ